MNSTVSNNSSQPPFPGEDDDHFHYLRPFVVPDNTNETTTTVSRAGIVDHIVVNGNSTDIDNQFYYCHIAALLPFSLKLATWGPARRPFRDMAPGMAATMFLAMDMLNQGDGSVIAELDGIDQACPIRFGGEILDSALSQIHTVQQVTALLDRQHQTQQQQSGQHEVCAFLGATRSAVTIPMAILTGLQDRPQLGLFSTSTALDNKEQFPLFGRLYPSDAGVAWPFLQYLHLQGVHHLGVVHWNDDYGNAYARALLQIATEQYPDLSIVSIDVERAGPDEAFRQAVQTLQKTGFRWFFGILGGGADYTRIITEAYNLGIAGTGEHVWMFGDALGTHTVTSLELERNSPLAQATKGLGMVSSLGGRTGTPVYNKFLNKLQSLNNPHNLDLLASLQPLFPDEPEYSGHTIDSSIFEADPARNFAVIFDETIALGLAACAALQRDEDSGELRVDGKAMFQALLNTTFQGVTGDIRLDPKTGTRLPVTALFQVENFVQEDINETHVSFRVQESNTFVDGQWIEKIPYIFNDGTTNVPADLPPPTMNYNYINRPLRITGLTMSCAVILLSLGMSAWTVSKRDHRVVLASQPIFLMIVCLGALVMGTTIIPLSIDDGIASKTGCDIACMAVPWLLSSGWALVFSALTSKIMRIHRIFSNHSIKRVTVTVMDVMQPFLGLMTLNFVCLIAWSIISPLHWEREIVNYDSFNRAIESRGFCTSANYLPFVIVLVVIDVGALLFMSYQSYLARGISTEFAESEFIAKAVACMLLVSFVGIPTIILVTDEPQAQFFVSTCIIFTVCTAVLLFIFVPKMLSKGEIKKLIRQSTSAFLSTSSNVVVTNNNMLGSDAGSTEGIRILNTREEDFHEVCAENERLKATNLHLEAELVELRSLLAADDRVKATGLDFPASEASLVEQHASA